MDRVLVCDWALVFRWIRAGLDLEFVLDISKEGLVLFVEFKEKKFTRTKFVISDSSGSNSVNLFQGLKLTNYDSPRTIVAILSSIRIKA